MLLTRDPKWGLVISILFLTGFLISCNETGTSDREISNPELTEAEWMLTTINDKPLLAEIHATLAFSDENQIIGSTGCNLYMGSYELGEGDAINFKPSVTTSWACEEPYFAQEGAMLMVLSSASQFTLAGGELNIYNPGGDLRGTFTKMEPLTLEGTVWRLESLGGGGGASVDLIENLHVSAVFDQDGNLSGMAGCNEYETTYIADAVSISIGPITTSQSSCLDQEGVTDHENNYFKALEDASSYRNHGIALRFFDQGWGLLATFLNEEIASQR